MSIKNVIRGIFTGLETHYIRCFHFVRKMELITVEWKNIIVRRNEWKPYKLTREQKEKIDSFYKQHYGRKIPYFWHRLYSNYTGVFDEKYLPEIIFSTKMEEVLNPYLTAFPLQNKGFNPQRLFSGMEDKGIKVPEAVFENCNGINWDINGNIIDLKYAKDLLESAGDCIIKPTIDSMGARGVRLIHVKNGTDVINGDPIEDILHSYRRNFIVQKRVLNHKCIAELYSHSVNTIRVITYLAGTEIKTAPLSMRIGMSGRVVDNAGIFIGVNDAGFLNDTGFSKKGIVKYKEHPDTGIKFEGYKIESMDKIVAAAKYLHSFLPQLRMISWDLALDQDGAVVVIECNTTAQSVWFPQMVNGKSIFGEDTGTLLKMIR